MIPWNDGSDESPGLDQPALEKPAPAERRRGIRRGGRRVPYNLGLMGLFVILVGVGFMSWRSVSGPDALVGGIALGETEIASEEPSAAVTDSAAPSEATATPEETAAASETTAGATAGTSPVITAAPTKVVPATPRPTARPQSSGVYGSAIAIDTKDNFVIGGPSAGKVSHRFRAGTSASISAIRWAQRGGSSGYSGGNGGTIRISVEADAGGQPSGQPLASLTYVPKYPGGNWVQFYQQSFPSPARVTAGRLYHIVFENVDGNAGGNYISANDVMVYRYVYSPRQVAMGNDYAVLYSENGGGWRLRSGDTPVMDLTYSNGRHDGMGYIEAMAAQAAYINGASRMAREHFTVSGGSRVVAAATVRVMRLSGSGSDPLNVRLETGSGAEIETVSIPATSVPVSTVGDTSGGTWVTVRFRQTHTLASGSSYNLRLSTGSGITYVAIPIREGTDSGFRSYRFTDGDGQMTTNGSTWVNCYRYSPVDLQFYFS